GLPSDREVMVAFHRYCHEDRQRARGIARPPFEEYFRALNEAIGDWERGASKDYRDYDQSARRLRSFTLDGQIESGGAWVGTPDEIKAIIHAQIDRHVRARLAADQFRRARRARGAKIDAAVRGRGDAGIRRRGAGAPARAARARALTARCFPAMPGEQALTSHTAYVCNTSR